MQISVNGQVRQLPCEITIAELLKDLNLDPRTLAVERNLQLVPRAQHGMVQLVEGDKIEVVTLVGGG
mgnify:FL=1